MSHTRATCFASILIALAVSVVATERPMKAADPKDVTFTLRGSVTCPGTRVYAGTTGLLKRVLCQEGAEVKAGEVLAELEDPELEVDLKLVEAELALALATEKEFVATKDGKVDVSPTKEQLARLKAQVKVAESRVDVVKRRAAALTVRSPIAGTIGTRNVDLGNFVRKGDTELFAVYDFSRPQIVVEVPELDIAGVRGKQRCTIRIDAFPTVAFEGEVVYIAAMVTERQPGGVDPLGRPDVRLRETPATVRVGVTVRPAKESEKVRLLPGMSAKVAFGKAE